MKGFISTLVFCGTLSLLAGPAVAKAIVGLHCEEGTCKYTQELGPDQTKEFEGHCAGEESSEFKMICHAVKGTTCTVAGVSPLAQYWTCTCTNWDPTQRKNVTIDVECKD